MISNQILQNTIEGLKGITRIDFCVMDTDGKSLASTFSEQYRRKRRFLCGRRRHRRNADRRIALPEKTESKR